MRRTISLPRPGFRTSVITGLSLILGVLLLCTWMNKESQLSNLKLSILQNGYRLLEKRIPNSYGMTPDLRSVPFTDFSLSMTKSGRKFWKAIKPGFKCPSNLLSRVGKEKGDGGKWMCGLETLAKRSIMNGHNCTLYSFGVAGDSAFEAAVLKTAQCPVYGYDPTVDKIGKPLEMSNPWVHFQKLGIAGKDTAIKRTLKTFMEENGHKFIDILKVDVEGAEYKSLDRMMKDFDQLPFGQLLIEFHSWSFKEAEDNRQIINQLVNLELKGARIFSVEPNPICPMCCAELSFINLNYLKLFFPDEKKT